MKNISRLLVVLICVVLCGCGKKDDGYYYDVIKQSLENSSQVKSLEANANFKIKYDGADAAYNMDMEMSMDMTATEDPLQMKMDIKANMGGGLALNMDCYMMPQDSEYTLYMNVPMSGWMKQSIPAEQINQYKVLEETEFSAELMTAFISSFKIVEDEKIDEKKYLVAEGVLQGSLLDEAMKNLNESTLNSLKDSTLFSLDGLAGTDESEEETEPTQPEIKMPDIPVKLYINEKEKTVYRVSINLLSFANEILNQTAALTDAASESTGEIKEALMEMTFTKYGDVETIELPEEAKSAIDMSEVYNGLDNNYGLDIPEES